MNELDKFVKHILKPQAYLRYGDDFIIIADDLDKLQRFQKDSIRFIEENLLLAINPQNSIIIKAKQGLKFLGVEIFPKGRRLNQRNWNRARIKLNLKNIASYQGLINKHSNSKRIKHFNWIILKNYDEQI